MNENWIVFTGLIRNEKLFIQKLNTAKKLKDCKLLDGIVFSTWIGEIRKYPKIKKLLKELDVLIVELSEPNLQMQGHIIHQMKSLYYGLLACPEQSYVYKTRPDIAEFDNVLLKKLFSRNYERKVNTLDGWPTIFKERIVVHSGFFMYPFYINDISFFGLKDDIKKLVHFDISFDVLYNNIAPEQYFFAKPFIEFFPIFEEYFSVNQGIMQDEKLTKEYITYYKKSDFLLKVLSTYLLILKQYFTIISFNNFSQNPTPSNFSYEDFFDANVPGLEKRKQVAGSIFFNNEIWLKQFFSKQLKDSPLKFKMEKIINNYSDYKIHEKWNFNPLKPSFALLEYNSYLLKNFSNNRTKINTLSSKNEKLIQGSNIRYKTIHRDDIAIKFHKQTKGRTRIA